MQVASDVKVLGVHIGHSFNFDLIGEKICQSAFNQLNDVKRL